VEGPATPLVQGIVVVVALQEDAVGGPATPVVQGIVVVVALQEDAVGGPVTLPHSQSMETVGSTPDTLRGVAGSIPAGLESVGSTLETL